jgi:hypothetical protein
MVSQALNISFVLSFGKSLYVPIPMRSFSWTAWVNQLCQNISMRIINSKLNFAHEHWVVHNNMGHITLSKSSSSYYNLSNVCLSVGAPTPPPGSSDRFPPNLVRVCRLAPELPLNHSFCQRSWSLGSKIKFACLPGPWTDFHQTWYPCVGLRQNYHWGVCFGKGQGHWVKGQIHISPRSLDRFPPNLVPMCRLMP